MTARTLLAALLFSTGCVGAIESREAGSTTGAESGGWAACRPACNGGEFCWLGACARVTAIAVGSSHTCAVTSAGDVQCWGWNQWGQLGNDSTADSSIPVPVKGVSATITAVAGGFGSTCALTTSRGVLCWGSNVDGELGSGSSGGQSLSPVAVSGLASGVEAIAANYSRVCAVTIGGAAICWGDNLMGALGDGSYSYTVGPVPVAGLSSGVAAIAVGQLHTCALTTSGGVLCWGAGEGGALGNGSMMSSPMPVPVSGLASGVTAITAGPGRSCALTSAGGVVCSGSNDLCSDMPPVPPCSLVPVPVAGLSSGVAAIAAGSAHTCALTSAGGVLCWGDNTHGQLGNGSTTTSPVPVEGVGLSSGVTAIAAGSAHTCALTTDGRVLCWGANSNGQLGNHAITDSLVPVVVVEP